MAGALSQRGVPCTLVERLPETPLGGTGLNLPANAIRALAQLGLADDVVDRGMPIRRREYRNASGRLLFSVNEEVFWGAGGPSVCVRRGDLLEVLLGAVTGVPIRWRTAVTHAESTDTGVLVELHGLLSQHYQYVVGADGSAGLSAEEGPWRRPTSQLRRQPVTDASPSCDGNLIVKARAPIDPTASVHRP